MNRLRVFIATTDGPSEIQSLVEEDPDIRSVVCLNGTTQSLPISKGYDAFVRKPTGVIERLTGNRVYRLDVSRPITNGNSWQLGVYLAHWLEGEGRLAQQNEDADGIILATGQVNARDLSVEAVGHIPEKLASAQSIIDEALAAGQALTILLPEGDDGPQDDRAVSKVSSIDDAIALLQGTEKTVRTSVPQAEILAPAEPPKEIPKKKAGRPDNTQETAKSRRFFARFLGGSALVVLAGLAAGGFMLWQDGPQEWETLRDDGRLVSLDHALSNAQWPALAKIYRDYRFAGEDLPDNLALSVVGEFPADGGKCAGLRFRDTNTKVEPLGQAAQDGDLTVTGNIPCRIYFELQNKAGDTRYLWLAVEPEMDYTRFRGRDERGKSIQQVVAPGESIRLDIRLPRFRQDQLDYRIRAAAYKKASDEITALVSGARQQSKKELQNLERYGVSVLNFTTVVKGR
ncbi:hypothetical protein [Aestuariispira ectoiniformans]|uniref:hypothetical protein n=1 Tax=Aestuariispira ectoiniformans TaxID=2775080 RepID=UPI00223B5655|nr:hypothetical protein [Aestuariispira ectoiniformans]